jgi:hypothetical protein
VAQGFSPVIANGIVHEDCMKSRDPNGWSAILLFYFDLPLTRL